MADEDDDKDLFSPQRIRLDGSFPDSAAMIPFVHSNSVDAVRRANIGDAAIISDVFDLPDGTLVTIKSHGSQVTASVTTPVPVPPEELQEQGIDVSPGFVAVLTWDSAGIDYWLDPGTQPPGWTVSIKSQADYNVSTGVWVRYDTRVVPEVVTDYPPVWIPPYSVMIDVAGLGIPPGGTTVRSEPEHFYTILSVPDYTTYIDITFINTGGGFAWNMTGWWQYTTDTQPAQTYYDGIPPYEPGTYAYIGGWMVTPFVLESGVSTKNGDSILFDRYSEYKLTEEQISSIGYNSSPRSIGTENAINDIPDLAIDDKGNERNYLNLGYFNTIPGSIMWTGSTFVIPDVGSRGCTLDEWTDLMSEVSGLVYDSFMPFAILQTSMPFFQGDDEDVRCWRKFFGGDIRYTCMPNIDLESPEESVFYFGIRLMFNYNNNFWDKYPDDAGYSNQIKFNIKVFQITSEDGPDVDITGDGSVIFDKSFSGSQLSFDTGYGATPDLIPTPLVKVTISAKTEGIPQTIDAESMIDPNYFTVID